MRKKTNNYVGSRCEKHVKKRGNPRKKQRKNREKTEKKAAIKQ